MGTTTATTKTVEFDETDELDKFADIQDNMISLKPNRKGSKKKKGLKKSREEIDAI